VQCHLIEIDRLANDRKRRDIRAMQNRLIDSGNRIEIELRIALKLNDCNVSR
jgi:hypothetical protein